jgi:hypothetical protein
MIGVLLLAALLAQSSASPQPEASPLKEITHVTARPLCTVIHDTIGPSVAALMENDESLTQGIKVLQRRAQLDRLGPLMGTLHIENDVSRVVHNLNAIDSLLKDSPDAAKNEGSDHDSIELLKQKIRLVTAAEQSELNLLDGTVQADQTYHLAQAGNSTGLMTTGQSSMDPAVDPSQSVATMLRPVQPLDAMHLAGIALYRAAIIVKREQNFTKALLSLAAQCKAPANSPVPPGPAGSPFP